ncbi:Xpo1-domain-containing protein [Rhizopus microsporus var. microsporus]|uniref:Exportin-T n=2 Tax=Rhizopus microsporus TaxID=58291 RepID=A0A2G4SJ67_RHIZD|nr:Xpo1-domain-containing protein [Rhizopus microsporus ATCC 52813]ORE03930.1 Xpo1-domain-containing protein [Rhizopus microsporus var. microsporus]PHZ08817.1 Xpo1-domain-containing protein [Rhizopus microsporus ATCC 52813]
MEQIEQAVMYALGPQVDPNLKAQANAYCESIKNSPDGWQVCLELFMKEPKALPEARFFALQVLENTLQTRFDTLDSNAVDYIRRNMMEYLGREFVDNNSASNEESFIRNKVAQSLTLLFIHVYPTIWPTFFKDMMALTKAPTGGSHEKAADFFVRLCISIDEEIARLDIPRTRQEVIRNTNIKDTMRMGDVQLLASYWFELLQEFRSTNANIAQLVLKNIGSYIAWMDISLVVNDQVMNVLYELLGDANLRIPACECLADVISKGMLPMDKLNMIQMLNIVDVLARLDLSEPEFVEYVARLVNVLGTELCKIYTETSLPTEGKAAAWAMIEQMTPYLLKFLANEYDDTSSAVFPFVNDMLYILKKQKKQMQAFSQGQHEFLGSLLNVVIMKMRYDEETDWGNDEDEPEEEALFFEMRKNLRIFTEHIAAINEELYVGFIHSFAMDIMNKYKTGTELDWRDVELCLYVLYCYGEALSKASMVFVNANDTLTPLGELISEMVSSNISAYPHPSAPLQYFENIARYYQFFEHRQDHLPQALSAFVDHRGLHHPLKQIRTRCWYLFHRFVKNLKSRMGPYVEHVLSSIGDLLAIQAEPVVETNTMDGMPIPAASTFDSQLYLFETVGLLISLEGNNPMKQTEYLKIVLEPLVEGIQKSLSQPSDDELFMLQLHHYIMAIGSVAKGYPSLDKPSEIREPWTLVFVQATEIILSALQAYSQALVIRDAVRYAFARLITCLGSQVLPYLPSLINGLLTECQVTELVDFLPFIGLVAHKYKPMVEPIMDELLVPLVKRVFDFLNTAPSGTDEAVLLLDLRKAYLNFITNLFNANLERVFISERNLEHLNTILQTVLHFAKDNSDPTTQKMSFGVFLKMVNSWANNHPGFDIFVYNELIPITFSVPMSAAFNLSDGQSILVFGEITSIQKAMCVKQGAKFIEYMKTVFFPSIQCPPETAETYCQAVQQYDGKQFKKYFQSFITEAKR